MSLFKKLFQSKKTGRSHRAFPTVPLVNIELPRYTRKRKGSLAGISLEEKLGQISQTMPKRIAALWQGKDQGEYKFFGFVKREETSKEWMLQLLGAIEQPTWKNVQPIRLLHGLGEKLSCITYNYYLAGRYQLYYRIQDNAKFESWMAYDRDKRQKVLCMIIKDNQNQELAHTIDEKGFHGKLEGLLDILDEGTVPIEGPFFSYKYKMKSLHYIIVDAPPGLVCGTTMLEHRRLLFDEAVTLLYQSAKVLGQLHESGYSHGCIVPDTIWLHREQPAIYINGFNLANEEIARSAIEPRDDQFLLGHTLYHMISGKNPGYNSENNEKISPLTNSAPQYPGWFSQIIEKMMEPNPENRFPTLRNMIETLAEELKEPEWAEGEEIVSTVRQAKPEAKKTASPKKARAKTKPMQKAEPPKTPEPEKPEQASFEEIDESEFEEFVTSPPILDCYLLCPPYQPTLLSKDKTFTIGRSAESNLILTSEDVSTNHAIITHENDRYILQDQQSSNGTMINKQKIQQHPLKNGDKITIGSNTITYHEVARGKEIKDQQPKLPKKTAVMPSMRRKSSKASLSGDLSQISLWQVLQMLAGEEKTGALTVHCQPPLKIYFLNGAIVHCQAAEETGREVFYQYILQEEGNFEFDPSQAPEEITMSDNVESLLMETARRLDEQGREL